MSLLYSSGQKTSLFSLKFIPYVIYSLVCLGLFVEICDLTWLEYGCIVYFLVLFTFLYKKTGTAYTSRAPALIPTPLFVGSVMLISIVFLCRVLVLFAFVLCYMPTVAGVSELSMRNCSIQFSVMFIVLICCVYISSR
jgi:hypothetical protein